MSREKLDPEEQQILEEFERGEWVSDLTPERRRHIQSAAEQTVALDQRLSVNISKQDLDALRRQASAEGMPCETLVTYIIHKYVSGGLVDAVGEEALRPE